MALKIKEQQHNNYFTAITHVNQC